MEQNNTNKTQNTTPQTVKPAAPISTKPSVPVQEQKQSTGRRHPGVLLIGRSQLSIFVEGATSIVTYPYPQEVIRDLDVVNKDLLMQQIAELFQKHQLPPISFYAIFANPTIFARQILSTEPAQKKSEEERFMNTIPFEEVSARHVTMDGKTYVVAANKHFYESLSDALERNGSEITLILPEFLFTKEVNLVQGLRIETALTLLHRMPAFRDFNFIQKEMPSQPTNTVGEQEQKKFNLQVKGGKSNQKFVIAGSATMVLGVFLAGYLLVQQNNTKPTHVLQQGAPQAVPTAAIPVTPAGQVASPSSNVKGAVSPTIVIMYQQSQVTLANQLKQALAQAGYTAVPLQNTSVIAARTYVVFNNYLSQPLRTVITNTVNSVMGNVTVYETNGASSDVVITLSSVE